MTRAEIYAEQNNIAWELDRMSYCSSVNQETKEARRTKLENRLKELDDMLKAMPYEEGMFAGVVKELQRLGKLPQD